MKQLFLLVAACLLYVTVNGQPPKKFNYQGIARNANGQPLANQALGLRISIIDSFVSDPVRYTETHTVTTNAYGLYNVAIGGGTVVTKEIDSVDWAIANKYLHVEIDPAGGTSYTSLGVTQLLSVPYAMYAPNQTQMFGIRGAAGIVAANTNAYVFVGPTATVTTTLAYGKVFGAASAVIALSAGGPVQVRVGLCHQIGSGTITNFVGSDYTEMQLTTVQNTVSASAYTQLAPGTYNVGFCVYNGSASAINNNDFVNGWIMLSP